MRRALMFSLVALFSLTAAAHPGQDKGKHAHDDDHHKEAVNPPTEAQVTKRLERVKKRAAERKRKRKQRQRDRRRALKKRLAERLKGGPITPEVKAELLLHAKRVATLRQIRWVAAIEEDFETVVAADKTLARENARHERWWRTARKPKPNQPEKKAEPPSQ